MTRSPAIAAPSSSKPDFADAWSNLGTSLHHSGHYAEAIVASRRAIAIDPKNANAHSGLGILLLMRGEFAEGWDEYEWRLQSTEVRLPYQPQRPWQGRVSRAVASTFMPSKVSAIRCNSHAMCRCSRRVLPA